MYKLRAVIGVFLALAVATLACGGGATLDETETIAKKFLQAGVTNDFTILQEIVHPQQLGAATSQIFMQAVLQGGGQVYSGAPTEFEYTELTIKTASNDGANAVVRATGKAKLTMMGSQIIMPIDMDINLFKENGKWYVLVPGANPILEPSINHPLAGVYSSNYPSYRGASMELTSNGEIIQSQTLANGEKFVARGWWRVDDDILTLRMAGESDDMIAKIIDNDNFAVYLSLPPAELMGPYFKRTTK
jgi:hypothetical protein